MAEGLRRRKFIGRVAALGCSAAASPLVTPAVFAAAPWDARLVVIILRGAMDGLDVLRPVGDPSFAAMRGELAGEAGPDLTGFHQLHPALARLMPLWAAGQLSFAQAVSTPYRDKRSHFDGQDLLEAGTPDLGGVRDGWLNRLLQVTSGVEAETAYAIGREKMRILEGAAPTAEWSPEANLAMGQATLSLLNRVLSPDPLMAAAAAQAIELSGIAEGVADFSQDEMMDSMAASNDAVRRGNGHIKIAEFAAAKLAGDSRIASFSIGGWDTHANQARALVSPLEQLADTILTLQSGLGGVWERTAVVAMTEFGRTARTNGSGGTDHGTGGVALLAGGALRGGQVFGHWPGMAEADLYQRRDLMPTGDVRAVAGWIMRDLFGMAQSDIERVVFPGLQMGDNPGLIL